MSDSDGRDNAAPGRLSRASKQKGREHAKHGASQPPSYYLSKRRNAAHAQPKAGGGASGGDDTGKEEKRRTGPTKFVEIASVIAATAAAVAAMFGVFANNRQADFAAGQLRVMQQQLNDARDAAESSAISDAMSVARQRQLLGDNHKLAAAAKTQADSTGDLATTGHGQLITAQDTAQRQLRAYVYALDNPLSNFAANQVPKWGLRFGTIGQTPAYEVQVRAVLVVAPRPLPIDMTTTFEAPDELYKMVLFPVNTQSIDLTLSCINALGKFIRDCLLTNEMFESLNAKNAGVALYMYGLVTYRDAFKAPHQTPFCFSLDVIDKRGITCPFTRAPN